MQPYPYREQTCQGTVLEVRASSVEPILPQGRNCLSKIPMRTCPPKCPYDQGAEE